MTCKYHNDMAVCVDCQWQYVHLRTTYRDRLHSIYMRVAYRISELPANRRMKWHDLASRLDRKFQAVVKQHEFDCAYSWHRKGGETHERATELACQHVLSSLYV